MLFLVRFITILLFLVNPIIAEAQYPAINSGRPRIYADSARLQWLKNNISVPGDCRDTYNNFLTAYNGWWINDPQLYLLGSDSTQWTWNWSSQWAKDEAMFTVFLYKVTLDTLALKRCRFIAQRAIGTIDTANFSAMEYWAKEEFLRKMSDAGSLLLDWCYNDFTPAIKQSLAKSMFRATREFMNTYVLSSAGNSYVSSHNAWNTIFCNQDLLTLYNADGLTSSQNDTVYTWFKIVYDKWKDGFLPCYRYYRDDDGGWNWGAAYSMWSLIDQFQLFENMRTGTNKNYYSDETWVKQSINQNWYFIQPDNKTLHLGDGVTTAYADRVDYLHARIYNDAKSLWRAQFWSQPAYTPNTIQKFTKLLYKDFNAATIVKPSPPLNWWSDKVGLSVSRSSWDSSATMVSFFNSPSKRAAHEHRDNNSFTIFKNAPLLIDAGYYDTYAGSHYRNYYQRTIAHNSICVFDSTEIYTNFGQPASNDGGQIESPALLNYNEIFLSQNQRGEWKKYAGSDRYSYNIADAQLSYDSNKLDLFRRRLLYIKPDKIIVLDHVHLRNRNTKQRDIKWIGHFANRPVINGNIINTQVPGHIETFNGNMYQSGNKNGTIAIKTLLPTNSNVTLTGGPGYEYWVNGTNYPPAAAPDTNYYTPGNWRIEVRPSLPGDSVIYLHTIQTGDTTNAAMPGGSLLLSNYTAGVDWADTLYFFPMNGEVEVSYHLLENVPGNRNTGLFAADLKPGSYYIKVDGSILTTANSDSSGILLSAIYLSTGNHKIEITPVITGINNLISPLPLKIFPNPVKDILNIRLPVSSNSFEINVYDTKGTLVLCRQNQAMMDISNLPEGLYFIRLISRGKLYTTTFLKL